MKVHKNLFIKLIVRIQRASAVGVNACRHLWWISNYFGTQNANLITDHFRLHDPCRTYASPTSTYISSYNATLVSANINERLRHTSAMGRLHL